MAGAVTAAVGALVLLVSQLALGGTRALPLLWSGYGLRWGVRELGLLVLVGAALARPRLPRSAAGWAPLVGGAVLACVGTALLGHSGTGRSPQPTRVLASAAHLGAAATWSGCLVVLAVVLAPHLRRDAAARDSARAVLQRFGPAATACVAVMVVTGVYLSSEVVGSVDAAIRTIYGRTLLLKVALAAVAGALALVNTVRLRRRSRRSTPRRTVLAEAAAAVGVLALAAVLTSGQPAMEPQLVQSTTRATDGLVDRKVADLQESVSIRPNRPGPNVVLVDVFDTRRPAPSPVRGVVVSLSSPNGPSGPPLRAEPLGDGRWSVSTDLDAAGAVTVHVAVQRSDLPDTTAAYGWTVGGAPEQTRPALVSTAPLGPALRVAATVLLLALLGAGLLVLVVRALGRGGPPAVPGARSGRRRSRTRCRKRHRRSAVPIPSGSSGPWRGRARRRPAGSPRGVDRAGLRRRRIGRPAAGVEDDVDLLQDDEPVAQDRLDVSQEGGDPLVRVDDDHQQREVLGEAEHAGRVDVVARAVPLDPPQHGRAGHPVRVGAVHQLDVERVVPVLGRLVDVDGQALGATAQRHRLVAVGSGGGVAVVVGAPAHVCCPLQAARDGGAVHGPTRSHRLVRSEYAPIGGTAVCRPSGALPDADPHLRGRVAAESLDGRPERG